MGKFSNDAPRMAAAIDNLLNGAVFNRASELANGMTSVAVGANVASATAAPAQDGAGNGLLGLIGGALAGLASVAGGTPVGGESYFEFNPGAVGDMSRSSGMQVGAC